MAFIRSYQESDEDAMIHVFRETAAPDLREAGEPVLHYASYLWCRPYFVLEPQTCYVLDDGSGQAVGYLLGVPHTPTFVQKYKETFIPYIKSQGMENPEPNEPVGWNENLPNALRHIMYNPQGMLHEEWPQLMESWPAHLHIDILPEFQRKGYGRQLIEMFCDGARKQGAKGVHLGMAAANDEAGKFYARLGFTRFPVVLDDGVSGEQGRAHNTIWLVKPL
ncbi:hypothetical protein LTR41_008517 [Exophiala xenobiotica]|nr:hypothetical protein LTR41_008517 [Exophiala xenobiotica]KAK5318571.1 hypothetical protein LTR93_007966 [Exophiala xenobiotica]